MKSHTAIILFLLSVGLFYTFTNVQYQKVKELRILAGEYQDVLKNASAIVDLRDNLLVTYTALPVAEIDRVNKALPDNIDIIRLALDLDGMASRYGISIKNIQVAMARANADFMVLPEYAGVYDKAAVSFSFVSNYDDFKRLLTDIEKSLRIMDVKSASFQVAELSLYEYQISADTYWLK